VFSASAQKAADLCQIQNPNDNWKNRACQVLFGDEAIQTQLLS
jgi:hypothetical protein